MEKIFFDTWTALIRTILIGIIAYIGLVAMLRVSGKRTLSKMNAFDLIITVALGSTFASILISKDVALAQGLLALALLIFLQFILTWLSVRYPRMEQFIKAEPQLLFYNGHYLHAAMKQERVTEEELQATIREQGKDSIEEISAIVLETDGSFSVIVGSQEEAGTGSAMTMVKGMKMPE